MNMEPYVSVVTFLVALSGWCWSVCVETGATAEWQRGWWNLSWYSVVMEGHALWEHVLDIKFSFVVLQLKSFNWDKTSMSGWNPSTSTHTSSNIYF